LFLVIFINKLLAGLKEMALSWIFTINLMIPFLSFYLSESLWLLSSSFAEFYEALIKLLYLPIIQLMDEVSDIFHVIRKAVYEFYIAALKKLSNP
jgi:hypothetical protein